MKKHYISIIIPVYKVEHYLRTCVDSVLSQTYANWELILVDDGSPDRCPAICDEYASKDNRIKVVHKENGGQASARNSGLDIAQGEYVTFVDSDDFLAHDALEQLVKIAVEYQAGIVQCGYIRGRETSFPKRNKEKRVELLDNHSVFTTEKANVLVWGKLYTRDVIGEVRMPKGKYYEDDFTTWKWYYAAKKIAITNRQLYYYSCNDSSTMAQHSKKANLSFIEAYDERIAFFEKEKAQDMIDMSRLQLLKILVLNTAIPSLTEEQYLKILDVFEIHWIELKKSSLLPFKYHVLFSLFTMMPKPAARLAQRLR